MKKSIALSIALLVSLGLAGCGNTTHHTTAHHPKTHKSSSKSSSSKSSSSSSSSASSQSKQHDTGKQQPANKQAVVRNNQPQNQPAAGNLHDFVNRYGMSPAEYKVQHDGMTPQQALDATPDNMKTTGELQLQHSMEQHN